MKKIILTLIIACLGWTAVIAQDVSELQGQVDFKFATAALRKGTFALTATRIDLGNMGIYECGLNERTNFVYQLDNESVVQVALNNSDPGLNGFGGITCKGNVTGANYSVDKKGNAHYDYNITGSSISAQVSITVYADGKYAMAYINPTFGSSRQAITLYGDLVPYRGN